MTAGGEGQRAIRVRQRLGKYRILRRLGEGGFATVFEAMDTIEGVRVALKIPHGRLVTDNVLDEFRKEVRLAARLNHPHILPLKNAEFIDGHFVVAFPVGERTLAERLRSRLAIDTALNLGEQMLSAIAHAHEHHIIHCDVKPDNLILFPDGELMLTDFGIAKVAAHTIHASGSGTVGYIAPEQAMGKPSFRSDVFSAGLVLYRMLIGHLPEWPFQWPPPGLSQARRRLHGDLIELLRKSIELEPRKRFKDGGRMLEALRRVKPRQRKGGNSSSTSQTADSRTRRDWRTMRIRQFQRQFGRELQTRFKCTKCEGPVSEVMGHCPWCGTGRAKHTDPTRFPRQCPRCARGMKSDWVYCPWCFGPGFEKTTNRQFSDVRYQAKCGNSACKRKLLMPFMRYCPWCRRQSAPQMAARWLAAVCGLRLGCRGRFLELLSLV